MNADEIYESNLQCFKVVKRYDNKSQCVCPAHDDKQASLTITKGRKCILFRCHAGCSLDSILSAVGLEKKDTFYESEYSKQSNWRFYVENREKRKIEAVYDYVSCNGKYAYTKIRLEGKKFIYGILSNDRFTYGLPRNTPRKSFNAIYGNIKAINKAVADNMPVFIVEGEKDVNTLSKRGYVAFCCGGANDWNAEIASIVQNANVVILADNDDAGMNSANVILQDVQNVAKSAKVIVPMPDVAKADISDYFQVGHSNQEFELMINNVTEKSKGGDRLSRKPLDVTLKELRAERYGTTDKDFARLFSDVFKNEHRYNPSRKDFMRYDGKRWVDDIEGLNARQSAKSLSDALTQYALSIDNDGKYMKEVLPLCNLRNRDTILKDSRDIRFFTNEDLDKNDYMLNVQNGTLDLSGDSPKFMEHDPEMLLSKICNVLYDPDAKCAEWDKFLSEIMQGDMNKIQYLQKIAGLSLTGCTEQESCYILYGSTTRNGKSTYCETLIYLMGDYSITAKPETLAVKQNLDSRQASGDIARLAGCRFVNVSEPPKRMLFDTALLKSLLGRDSITARHLHQREFEFIPKFKLVINTNYLPTITDDTVFSSGRINVISFDRHFEPHEQDKHLKDRLRQPSELSGILNWCIEGWRLYREQGLEPPAAVKNATAVYRSDSDKIGSFINECLTKSERNSKAKDIYDVYAKWCDSNGYGTENKGNFFSELKNKGVFSNTGTVGGKTVKNIVKGYIVNDDFVMVDDDTELPFD